MACIENTCSKNIAKISPCGTSSRSSIQLKSSGPSPATYTIRVEKAGGVVYNHLTDDDGGAIVLYMAGGGFVNQDDWPEGFFTENQGPYTITVLDSNNAIVQQDDSTGLILADCVTFDIGQPAATANPNYIWTFET